MKRIKKGDEVIILTGKSKGMRGKVLRVIGEKVLVEGAQLVKKHTKPNPNANNQGGIIEREAPIHISNVALYNSVTKKPGKVGFKTLDSGKRVRIFKATKEQVDL
jgi:large subunit ribosomal protein L24